MTIVVNPVLPKTSHILILSYYFDLVESIYAEIKVFDPQTLNDHCPLVVYIVGGDFGGDSKGVLAPLNAKRL